MRYTPKIKEAAYHAINGVRSGIPLCCVLFFVIRNLRGEQNIAKNATERRGEAWPDGIPYVQCDRCHSRGNEVEVKENGVCCEWLMHETAKAKQREAT